MVLERYIYRELAQKLFWTAGLLILILASDKFVRFLAEAAAGKLPGDMVFMLLGYKLVAVLPKILPVALFVAVLLVFARMTRDRELVILSAAGMGRQFQIGITLRFACMYAIVMAFVCIHLAPWAESKLQLLKAKGRQEASLSGITAGHFKEFGKGRHVIYIENLSDDKQTMENVFLHLRKNGKLDILKASSARFEFDQHSEERFIVFENGRHYVGQPGSLDYRITEYATYAVRLEQSPATASRVKIASLSFAELWRAGEPNHRAEIHWRLALIIACVLLAWFAVLLSPFMLRERIFIPFAGAILVYLIYSTLLSIGRTLLQRDLMPAYIGLWWVHLLLIGGIAGLYYLPLREYRHKQHR